MSTSGLSGGASIATANGEDDRIVLLVRGGKVGKDNQDGNRQPAIRVVLLPKDTNTQGTIFGGIILSHIDLAGAVECGRHTAQKIVTVAMNEVVFKAPVLVGEVVSFYANVVKIGRTSISVQVEVEVDRRGQKVRVTQADLVYVCVDASGKAQPIISSGT